MIGAPKFFLACLVLLVLAFFPSLLRAQSQGDWPVAGHDPGAQRYSPLKQINTHNVTKLHRAWTFHTGDGAGDVCGPAVRRAAEPLQGRRVSNLKHAASTSVAAWDRRYDA